jgi:hypothetical protein
MKKIQDPQRALSENPKTSESRFLKFSWIVILMLAMVLAGAGVTYVTCGRARQGHEVSPQQHQGAAILLRLIETLR